MQCSISHYYSGNSVCLSLNENSFTIRTCIINFQLNLFVSTLLFHFKPNLAENKSSSFSFLTEITFYFFSILVNEKYQTKSCRKPSSFSLLQKITFNFFSILVNKKSRIFRFAKKNNNKKLRAIIITWWHVDIYYKSGYTAARIIFNFSVFGNCNSMCN